MARSTTSEAPSEPGRRDSHSAHASGKEGMVDAFVQRYTPLLHRLGASASEQSLLDALAARDDVGGLATLIAEVGPVEAPAPDPLAAAYARAATAKTDVLEKSGGAFRVSEVAGMLNITRQAVDGRRARKSLLAVQQPNGEHVYPAVQFQDGRVAAGMDRFLKAFRAYDPWTALGVLIHPSPRLGGRPPIEALREGDVQGAVAVAARYGEHLA